MKPSDPAALLPGLAGLRLYVCRHAESLANQAGLIASDPGTAIDGWGLSAAGIAQAAAAGLPFPAEPVPVIVSSDFRRARETAEILAGRCGAAQPVLEPLLRERGFMAFEGQSHDRYRIVWEHDARGADCPGVETIASVCGRIDRLLASLAAQHRGRTVILVSHGDVLQILLARAAGLDPHRHRELAHLGNAECRRVPGALP